MYLHACQARGLGKFYSQRTSGVTVLGYVTFYRKNAFCSTIFDEQLLGRPCRELSSCNQRVGSQTEAFVVLA